MYLEITQYDKLYEVIDHFNRGVYEILILEGLPGTGKSQIVKQALCTIEHCWLEGRTSAPAFYELLYQYMDLPIVLDDADMFIQDKQCLNLLKTLCQTDKDKRVQWLTVRRLPEGIPKQFDTSSTVIIITNQWKKMSPHLAAVQDRGLYVSFRPTYEEIHAYASTMCCLEVHQFFGMFLHTIKTLSLRHYVIAQRMHAQCLPWRRSVLHSWQLDALQQLYIEIEIDYPELVEQDRKLLFLQLSGKKAQAYERVRRQLMGT